MNRDEIANLIQKEIHPFLEVGACVYLLYHCNGISEADLGICVLELQERIRERILKIVSGNTP
jgi:hypothetical protein